jgi:hypothetical protein
MLSSNIKSTKKVILGIGFMILTRAVGVKFIRNWLNIPKFAFVLKFGSQMFRIANNMYVLFCDNQVKLFW